MAVLFLFSCMKRKVPFLTIISIVNIIYAILFYRLHGMSGDHEGWGLLATIIISGAWGLAIIIDVILFYAIKNNTSFYISEAIVAVTLSVLLN